MAAGRDRPEAMQLREAWKIRKPSTLLQTGLNQPGLAQRSRDQLFSQWIRPIQLGTFCKDTGTLNAVLPTEFSGELGAGPVPRPAVAAWKIARSEVKNVKIAVHPGRRKLADLDFKGEDGLRAPRAPTTARTAASRRRDLGPLAMESIGDGRVHLVGRARPVADVRRVRQRDHQRLAKTPPSAWSKAEKPQFSPPLTTHTHFHIQGGGGGEGEDCATNPPRNRYPL
jgi:chromosomal replication initiator protein